MVTTTLSAMPPAPPPPSKRAAKEGEPVQHAPASAYKTVWVFHYIEELDNRVGWVHLLEADADALIAAGHAQDPYANGTLEYIHDEPAPTPAPSPAPSPAPTPAPSPAPSPAPTPAPPPTEAPAPAAASTKRAAKPSAQQDLE